MDSSNSRLEALQARLHPSCFVCGGSNPHGLGLIFEAGADDEFKATFQPNTTLEGYEGLLHGGITASLLDGVMTNCLFAQGVTALTAELKVRYREPVSICGAISLSARIEQRHPPLYLLTAELIQDGRVRANALAKFMERRG